MINTNTDIFWDYKLKIFNKELNQSPVYKYKIAYVVNKLRNKRGKVLDVGVGGGLFEKTVHTLNKNLELNGIDISKKAILEINRAVSGNFTVANAKNIPFQNKIFDFVIILDVLEHFYQHEIKVVMKEIIRVLKNNGKVIISVPLNEAKKDSVKNRHLYWFDEKILNQLFFDYGFNVIEKKFVVAFPRMFLFKNFINSIFGFKKPNLVVLICKKK